MPFIMAKVNVPVSSGQEEEISKRLGKAIGAIPGKSEEYLMFGIEDCCRFHLRGTAQKAAYIEAAIFGNEDHAGFAAFARSMTEIFHEVLGIPPANIYAKFEDIAAWSVSGMFIGGGRGRQHG